MAHMERISVEISSGFNKLDNVLCKINENCSGTKITMSQLIRGFIEGALTDIENEYTPLDTVIKDIEIANGKECGF